MKYFAASSSDNIPYGFQKTDEISKKNSTMDYMKIKIFFHWASPMKKLSLKQYAYTLTGLQRQQLMMKAVILDTKVDISNATKDNLEW